MLAKGYGLGVLIGFVAETAGVGGPVWVRIYLFSRRRQGAIAGEGSLASYAYRISGRTPMHTESVAVLLRIPSQWPCSLRVPSQWQEGLRDDIQESIYSTKMLKNRLK